MEVRIKFIKHGAMKPIGHLDTTRYFQEAMHQADMDIRYSEGSGPHQVISFAVSFGAGLTSNGEYMDIKVNFTKDSKTMVYQLNEVMVEGVEVLSCRRLEDTVRNATPTVVAVGYTVRFRDRVRPNDMDALFEELISFYGREFIVITKKTKWGEQEVDLKSLIHDPHREGDIIFLQLSTRSPDDIKPELVLRALHSGKRQTFSELNIWIQQEEAYGNTGDEKHRVLTPLEDFGEDTE